MERQLLYSLFRLSRVTSILEQTQHANRSLPPGVSALLAVVARAYGGTAAPIAAPGQGRIVSVRGSCLAPLFDPNQPSQLSLSTKQPQLCSPTALSRHSGGDTLCFSTVARPGISESSSGGTGRNSAEVPSTSGRNFEGTERHQPPKAGSTSGESKSKSSIDAGEVAKFAAMADSWWDYHGDFAPLHKMNPVRCAFIRSALCHHFGRDASNPAPLQGLTILDVGCGGGLLCEPLARMGATVTGVDATAVNIQVAKLHAAKDPATADIRYEATTAEALVSEGRQFDAVMALEVVEHVADPLGFCRSLGQLCRTGGGVFMSTINRTPRAYALAIGAAEYVLRWVPRGTHDWSRFVTPEELALALDRAGLEVDELAGMVYNPLTRSWSLAEDTGVNYILFAKKNH